MKNVIKHLKKGTLMVIMFTTLLSFANDASLFNIENDAESTSLTLYDVKQGNLLSVIDENGTIIYKEIIKKAGTYNKNFDLTALPDGEYIFELDKDLEISSIPFKVTKNVVVFDKENEKTIFKPMVRVDKDIVYISKLSLNEEPLKIEVYFESSTGSELIFSETIENTQIIERAFELYDNLGTYTFILQTDGREFTETIN